MNKHFRWAHVVLIIGVMFMIATIVIGLIAVWTINKIDQGHLAGTAGILGVAGFVAVLGSAIALS